MKEYQGLTHARWDCKYNLVFISIWRKKALFGAVRKHLGSMLHELAQQKKCKNVEGHVMPDHVHMCVSIPPKHTVSHAAGFFMGKSAIGIARRLSGKTGNFTGENFRASGYLVSTVGLDEELVRTYIRHQESEDERYEQLKLGM